MAQQLTVSNEAVEPDVESLSEHDQEMLDKVDGNDGVEIQDEGLEVPQDKFDGDYDKLKQSYEELERKFHSGTSTDDGDDVDTANDLEIGEPSESPFDMKELQDEYVKNGQLGENSYKKLEEAGIGKEYVDTYIAGAKALGEQMGNTVRDAVGGTDNYSNMVEWAQANYNSEQIVAYDKAVNSGDINGAMLAAKGLQADYQRYTGQEGITYSGKQAASERGGDTFRSNSELTAAMKDSRYEYDQAYRQDVLDKLDRSDLFTGKTI